MHNLATSLRKEYEAAKEILLRNKKKTLTKVNENLLPNKDIHRMRKYLKDNTWQELIKREVTRELVNLFVEWLNNIVTAQELLDVLNLDLEDYSKLPNDIHASSDNIFAEKSERIFLMKREIFNNLITTSNQDDFNTWDIYRNSTEKTYYLILGKIEQKDCILNLGSKSERSFANMIKIGKINGMDSDTIPCDNRVYPTPPSKKRPIASPIQTENTNIPVLAKKIMQWFSLKQANTSLNNESYTLTEPTHQWPDQLT